MLVCVGELRFHRGGSEPSISRLWVCRVCGAVERASQAPRCRRHNLKMVPLGSRWSILALHQTEHLNRDLCLAS